jgi:hypothetical protein
MLRTLAIIIGMLIVNSSHAQCSKLKISEIKVKLLPCLSNYDELINENNILSFKSDYDTTITSKRVRKSMYNFIKNSFDHQELESVLDARVYLECIYKNQESVIIVMDYYGRFRLKGKSYTKSKELIKILGSELPVFQKCVEESSID